MVIALCVLAALSVAGMTGCSKKGEASATGSLPATQTPPPPPSGPKAALADEGEKLEPVAIPPAEMISRMRYMEERKGSVYDVTFEPYGFGARTEGYASVMAQVGATITRNKDLGRLPIDRNNALLLLKKGVKVEAGGSYKGTLTLLTKGDSMYFLLTEVSAE